MASRTCTSATAGNSPRAGWRISTSTPSTTGGASTSRPVEDRRQESTAVLGNGVGRTLPYLPASVVGCSRYSSCLTGRAGSPAA